MCRCCSDLKPNADAVMVADPAPMPFTIGTTLDFIAPGGMITAGGVTVTFDVSLLFRSQAERGRRDGSRSRPHALHHRNHAGLHRAGWNDNGGRSHGHLRCVAAVPISSRTRTP